MTIDDRQIAALVFLAKGCRPLGARRWDEAGTRAAIAQVKDRSLAEVVLAVIRAAADRDVESPGVIPTNGSHWREQLAQQPFVPQTLTSAERCTVCSHSETVCRMRWAGDHEFTTLADLAREKPLDTHAAVEGIKDIVATAAPVREPEPPGLDAVMARPSIKARVAEMQAEMAAATAVAASELEESK